jgi:hypothetical protein
MKHSLYLKNDFDMYYYNCHESLSNRVIKEG